MIQKQVRVARNEYRCDAPWRPCSRRINKGDPYTATSFPPGADPFNSTAWINLRACSTCSPIPHDVDVPPSPCPVGSASHQCELSETHPGPHQYPIGLF